jgi:oxygen-independent coproporphyrinogen III oxidase
MRGLYIHIPFCSKKCHYCNFVITTDHSHASKSIFFEALDQEILAAKEKFGRLKFDTLYLGGGTPSLMTEKEMARLLQTLRREFDFNSDCEVTCEVNPGHGDIDKFKAYKKLGINRISLGVQSFTDSLLKDMGRVHTAQDTRETLALLNEAGFHNMSFDFLVCLPNQKLQDFESSLKEAVQWDASQISLYDLEVHDQTVYGNRKKRGELILPPEEEHVKMVSFAEDYLRREGYLHYEISNFAKPGLESKHNLIYWNNREYLGLGPGAFSYLSGVRYQFAQRVEDYLKKCAERNWSNDVEDVLTDEKKEMETLLTSLRRPAGVNLADFKIIRDAIENEVAPLVKAGLLSQQDNRVVLTRQGRFLAETVFAHLV